MNVSSGHVPAPVPLFRGLFRVFIRLFSVQNHGVSVIFVGSVPLFRLDNTMQKALEGIPPN